MKNAFLKTKLFLMVLSAMLAMSCSVEDGEDGAIGPQGPQGEQGPAGPEGAQGEDGQGIPDIYTSSGQLNAGSDITDAPTPVGPALTVEKIYDDTHLEVFFNSNVYATNWSPGISFVEFQIRLDGAIGITDNSIPIGVEDTDISIALFEVFQGLPVGSYSIQIYARTNPGESARAVLDPGGFGGRITAKETL